VDFCKKQFILLFLNPVFIKGTITRKELQKSITGFLEFFFYLPISGEFLKEK